MLGVHHNTIFIAAEGATVGRDCQQLQNLLFFGVGKACHQIHAQLNCGEDFNLCCGS
ncbi:hypothetical protein L195_g034432 [Trifolium pratense]|uniref:Uncharacterized protein n=1 Tax=Trifolium pratense TaxID=57577 RepID=A0A2K3LIT5_TRIPR|nr:hypothetical protein L195_g034432 [Trifolium pratense]